MAKKKGTKPKSAGSTHATAADGALQGLSALHLRWGWWTLLAFLTLGLVLEALHGLKIDAYLGVANQTRRLMWTLAHAHGTLLGLVHIAFAVTLSQGGSWSPSARRLASRGLIGSSVLLPLGFFLGGAIFHEGDPGLGVLLVPLGGVLLLAAVFAVARGLGTAQSE